MTRHFARAVARALIGVLFMAQMAVAAYACPALSTTPSTALGTDMPMANCEGAAGAMDPSSANLCAEHCKAGQQSDQATTLNVPAAVLTALYANPLVPAAAAPPRTAAATMSALVAASPPHAILHCVFRI